MTSMRLLAVDDDPVFLMLLKHVLSTIGYEDIQTVNSGAAAIALLRDPKEHFDCLLLDIDMPEMTGIELCQRLRHIPAYRDTPVLMITAMKTLHFVENAFRAGANDYIHKPVDELELGTRLRMIRELLAERRRRASVETQVASNLGLPVLNVTFEEPVSITEAGSVIDYLALENYALTLGRLRLYGHSVMGFSVVNALEIYRSTDGIGYVDTMAIVASAIDRALKSFNHLIAFAGRGEFVAMISQRTDVSSEVLQDEIEMTMARYAAVYNDLEIPLPKVHVGEIMHAGFFTRTTVNQLIAKARESAARLPVFGMRDFGRAY